MKNVFVVQGNRRRNAPEHVAKLMVEKYGWSYEVPKAVEVAEVPVSQAKQEIRDAQTEADVLRLIEVERSALNRASVIKVAEKRLAELADAENKTED